MSWQVKWKVPFVARNNKKYVVDILEDTEETISTVHELYGATKPFETSETNSEEYFLPIRSQTGYLRFKNTGTDRNGMSFDWTEIIPINNTQHQVRLMYEHESRRDTIWIGYIKSGMFTTQAFQKNEDIELPVICPVELLKMMPLTFSCDLTTEITIKSVAQLIHMALSSTGISWQKVYISRNIQTSGSNNINEDINSMLSLMNYTDVDPVLSQNNTVATWVDTKPMGDLIESIFKFWGWTLFSRGLDIYIIASGEENYDGVYRKFDFSQLSSSYIYPESTEEYVPISLNLSSSPNDMSLEYMSTNNYEEYVLGRRKIKIEANVNEQEIVIASDFKELQFDKQQWENGVPTVYYDEITPKYYSFQFNTLQSSFVVHLHKNLLNVTAKSIFAYTYETVVSLDDTWGIETEKTSFNPRQNIEVLWEEMGGTNFNSNWNPSTDPNNPPTPTQALLRISTIHSLCIPEDSMISITASARRAINPLILAEFNSAYDHVWMQVKINNESWFTTTATWVNDWTTDPTQGNWYYDSGIDYYFRAPINNFSKLKTTKQLPIPFYGASGFCIRMMQGQSSAGRLQIAILDNPSRNVVLDNLQVKIVPKDDMMFPVAKATHTYQGVANNTFMEDENISLDIASGSSNKYGKGQLFRSNYKYFTTVRFYSETEAIAPEQHLVNRMVNVFGKKRNRFQIVVMEDTYNNSSSSTNAAAVGLPTTTFLKNWDNNQEYMIQAVDHDWVNSTMKLTLIEKD